MSLQIQSTVAALLASDKGVLTADESFPTIEKRFKARNIPSTEENRHAYREMLFTTPGLNEFISGAILFDETMRQKTRDGVPFSEVLAKQGIVPAIKVNKGTTALAKFPAISRRRKRPSPPRAMHVRGVLLWNIWEQVDTARELIAEPGPFRLKDLKGRLK